MLWPIEGRGEARVFRPGWIADGLAEPLPLLVVGDGDDHPGVVALRTVAAVGRSGLVPVAAGALDAAAHRVVQVRLPQMAHVGLALAEVDELALARAVAIEDGGHCGEGRGGGGDGVGVDGALKPRGVLAQVASQRGVAGDGVCRAAQPLRVGNQFSKRNCASGPLKHHAEPQRECS